MSVSLVIPIKQLENAKQRLGGLLSVEQRRGLFQAMVEDVLEAATTCDRVDEVIVVTRDATVKDLARSYSARVLPEPENPGLIAAVTHAATQLSQEGVDVMVFLPGDVPMVTVEELEIVLDGFGRSADRSADLSEDKAEFMIVPANDLGGSNCVVCSPPDCMEFGFGEDSFRRHLRIAKDRGINAMVVKLPGIGLDIDTPEDLFDLVAVLARQNLRTNTVRFLENSGMLHDLSAEVEKRLTV